MTKIKKAIIVDDELHGIDNLSILIKENLPEINVVATAKDAFEAKMMIDNVKPDLVFLDINMGKINGIELLNSFDERTFEVIFVTAYDKYALDALRAGATGYILKPIIIEELVDEVRRVCKFISDRKPSSKSEEPKAYPENLMINHSKGYFFIDVKDIIRLEAFSNYSKIYLQDNTSITTSRTLKNISEQLNPEIFLRIHKTHLVNLNFVKEYKSSGDGSVILKDNTEIKVAVLKRADFKKRLIAFMK